jgi:hypothetical protein
VKPARASFPRVEAPRPLGEREKMFRGLHRGDKEPLYAILRLGAGRLSETVRKTCVSIASAAPNLRDDVRSACDLYHKIISSRGV